MDFVVNHGPRHLIFECNSECACVKAGTCKNQAFQRRQQNPFSFLIFKTDGRGWGLKCLDAIQKGQIVLQYVGEVITLEEFHERENDQERKGKMYGLELQKEEKDDNTYCIDSGYVGNHARFINHSCDPNLYIQRIYGTANNNLLLNRPEVVLIAKRNVRIGEELTFNYQMILEEDIHDNYDAAEVKTDKRKFKCQCGSGRKCSDYVWAVGEKEQLQIEAAIKRKKRLALERKTQNVKRLILAEKPPLRNAKKRKANNKSPTHSNKRRCLRS